MSHNNIPAGCHDADSAAALLKISKKQLLQKMRELGWLKVGGGPDNHNLPTREYLKAGLLCTHDRGFCLKGKKEITKTYRVMLLTQDGYQALKKQLSNPHEQPVLPPKTTHAPALKISLQQPCPHKAYDQKAADEERQKVIDQMAEWNLPIASGRN